MVKANYQYHKALLHDFLSLLRARVRLRGRDMLLWAADLSTESSMSSSAVS